MRKMKIKIVVHLRYISELAECLKSLETIKRENPHAEIIVEVQE